MNGIRQYHLIHMTEDKEKLNACLSPSIMMNDPMYRWKTCKIPKLNISANVPQLKVAKKRKLPSN